MTLFRSIFFVIFFLALCNSCSKTDTTITVLNDPANFKYIYHFNNEKLSEDTKSWKITKENFTLIDSLLKSKLLKNGPPHDVHFRTLSEKYLENYFRQYIPYIDKNGDRIVYINAACYKSEHWKTNLIIARDGGDCYWQLKINLDKKIMYEFHTNSIA
ncbi:hypothetical protein [uncultured Dokdonia sp.]|uniref:hypothetical protein n=1 Tax=uncultured Dokdonia sp. TaxID=575653 RepID=UPI0026179BDD|nr:hypothetical protein [uncultured Dokdonia sp.]